MSNIEKAARPGTHRIPREFFEKLEAVEFVIPDKPIPGILLIDWRMMAKLQEFAANPAITKKFDIVLVAK